MEADVQRVSAFAWRLMGDADGVEEAVQDAWVEILRDLPRLRDVDAFPAFAFRIVQRRCARLIRERQSGRRLKAGVEAEPPPEAPDMDRSLDAQRIRTATSRAPRMFWTSRRCPRRFEGRCRARAWDQGSKRARSGEK